MEIKRITGEQCQTVRSLWEEVFYEDTEQFTEYYFSHKAEKNIGYVVGDSPYSAMMFCTPYRLSIYGKERKLSYIVGVATRKECRHQGYMSALLRYSFREMYRQKQEFAFLMPADPAIYEPFGFSYIYEREIWKLKEPEKQVPWLENLSGEVKSELRAAQKETAVCRAVLQCSDPVPGRVKYRGLNGLYSAKKLHKEYPEFPVFEMLAEFAASYLKERYDIYVLRDAQYYREQSAESEAQNGDIYIFFQEGQVQAFFLYAREDGEVFLQEVMEKEEGILDFLQKQPEKKPMIMARILHAEEMLRLLRSRRHRTVLWKIEDRILSENNGVYRISMTPEGSRVERCKEETAADRVWKIQELTEHILTGAFINEIV